MKKKILLGVFVLTFFLVGIVNAQVAKETEPLIIAPDIELPEPGILPNRPFYFLKGWVEAIGNFFTFGDIAKTRRYFHLAEKRLAEVRALVEEGRPELVERILGRYQEHLEKAMGRANAAKEKGQNIEEVLARVAEATLKHQSVLAGVYEKVPEAAKSGIERAMEVSLRGHKQALEALSKEKKKEVFERTEEQRKKVEEQIERLEKRGIRLPPLPTKEELEIQLPEIRPGEESEEIIEIK